MKAVSCRSIFALVEAAAKLGVDKASVLKRVELEPQFIQNFRNRISWAKCLQLNAEIAQELGSEEREIELGREVVRSASYQSTFSFLRCIASPRLLYRALARFGGRMDFPFILSECKDLPDGRIQMTLKIPEGYADNPHFFRVTQGVIENLPLILGARPSWVTVEQIAGKCTYWITVPHFQTAWWKLKNVCTAIFRPRALIDELGVIHDDSMARFNDLTESRRDFFKVIESMPDGVLIHREGRILYANPVFRSFLELSPTEAPVGQEIARFFSSGEFPSKAQVHALSEVRFVTRSGKLIILETSVREEVAFENSQSSLIIARDVTAKKGVEEALIEQQKLAALGEVIAEVAHEVRNPLTVITCLAARYAEDDGSDRSAVSIMSNAERISRIMDRLNRFSRRSFHDPMTRASFRQPIQEALALCLRRAQRQGVALSMTEAEADLEVRCRPSELCQVFVNLINNACDAAAGSEDKWVKVESSVASEGVLIKITDSGKGIPAEVAARMFDSFFTTKAPGSGTGLGLSISKRIIEQHRGKLELDTESAHTCFVVRLPRPPQV